MVIFRRWGVRGNLIGLWHQILEFGLRNEEKCFEGLVMVVTNWWVIRLRFRARLSLPWDKDVLPKSSSQNFFVRAGDGCTLRRWSRSHYEIHPSADGVF